MQLLNENNIFRIAQLSIWVYSINLSIGICLHGRWINRKCFFILPPLWNIQWLQTSVMIYRRNVTQLRRVWSTPVYSLSTKFQLNENFRVFRVSRWKNLNPKKESEHLRCADVVVLVSHKALEVHKYDEKYVSRIDCKTNEWPGTKVYWKLLKILSGFSSCCHLRRNRIRIQQCHYATDRSLQWQGYPF